MPEGSEMVVLQDAASQFIGQQVVVAAGNTPHVPFNDLKGQVLRDILTPSKELFFLFDTFAIRIHLVLFGKWVCNATLNRQLHLGLQCEEGTSVFMHATVGWCLCLWINRKGIRMFSIRALIQKLRRHK